MIYIGGVNMKKKDIIRKKNNVKQTSNYCYLRYASYACIILVLLFLMYISIYVNIYDTSLEKIMSENPMVIMGFIISTANLYIWYVLKNFLKDIVDNQHIASMQVNLMIMAIAQFVLMNFVSSILLLISLKQYFQWSHLSIKKILKEIKNEQQMPVFIVTSCFLILMISSVYGIYMSI